MKVVVFGIGRSGTSLLYALLQRIMAEHFGEPVDYIYEPFLWDRDTFNARYEEYRGRFAMIDSLSHEGMCAHQRLPLFLSQPEQYCDDPFVRSLLQPQGEASHLLLKAIRINGRFESFLLADADVRFVFAVRNPIDVINSVLPKFSFFGRDFHRDDAQRFSLETQEIFGEDPDMSSLVGQYASYWYYMNRFVFERLPRHRRRVLVVPHERLVQDRPATIGEMCEFLGLPFKKSYVEQSELHVGITTQETYLARGEFEELEGMLEAYRVFLSGAGLGDLPLESVGKKYESLGYREASYRRPFDGFTAHAVALKCQSERHKNQLIIRQKEKTLQELRARTRQLRENNEKLQHKSRQLQHKNRQLQHINRQLQHINRQLQHKNRHIEELRVKLRQKQSGLEQAKKGLEASRREADGIRKSMIYRVGRIVTAPVRLVLQAIGRQSGESLWRD